MLTISKYQAGQLSELLGNLQSERVSGSVYLSTTTDLGLRSRSYVLILKNGQIIYGGLKVPTNNLDFARMIGDKFHYSFAEAAVKYTAQKLNNRSSFRELLERIVAIRVFKWEEIEAVIHAQVVQVIEQILPQPGELKLDSTTTFDLSYGADGHGLDWSKLMEDLNTRNQEWAEIVSFVPSINAVPILANSLQTVTDSKVQQHLKQWVDGVRSLIDIAEEMGGEDPLQLAQLYRTWVISGWVSFHSNIPQKNVGKITNQLPIILSVDDSLIVQTMIKRVLSERYQVLLASKAIDALNVINTNPISLLLLDVTMPEIDGLEFCRTIRSIEKFKHLPIIMITARDKFSDKLRGQIAGATYYLTKPIEPNQLIEIVDKYVETNKL